MPDFDPVALLAVLVRHQVRFVLIGGVAARLHGAPILTQDVDVSPDTEPSNLTRLAEALRELDARLRTMDEPEGVPFPFEPGLLSSTAIWTLMTRYGDLDLVMTPEGTAGYRDLVRDARQMKVALEPPLIVSVASLADVIRSKEAAGREKDRATLPLLRRTLEESTD